MNPSSSHSDTHAETVGHAEQRNEISSTSRIFENSSFSDSGNATGYEYGSVSCIDLIQRITNNCMCFECFNRRSGEPETELCTGPQVRWDGAQSDESYLVPKFFEPIQASTPLERSFSKNPFGGESILVTPACNSWDTADASILEESSLCPLVMDSDHDLSVDTESEIAHTFQEDQSNHVLVNVQTDVGKNETVIGCSTSESSHAIIKSSSRRNKGRQRNEFDETPNCSICGRISSGTHYSAIACEGCKAFFRRIVTKKRYYQCKNNESCMVELTHRRSCCKSCRFGKCIEAGMKPEACYKHVGAKVL